MFDRAREMFVQQLDREIGVTFVGDVAAGSVPLMISARI